MQAGSKGQPPLAVASAFTPHVDATFRFGAAALLLTKVETCPASGDGREAFILIFAGPPHPVLAEGSYETAAPDGATWALYIMPIHTAAKDRQDYQVVFN